MNRLDGKVAIVAGGASGLGEAIARCFVAEGATVFITDIQVDKGQLLAEELPCQFIEQGVLDEEQWEAVIREVTETNGRLDTLVNNAGAEGDTDTNPETATLSDWRRVQTINVESAFLGCRAAIPTMRKTGGGSIINISSIASVIPTPHITAYGASKAAVRQLTKSVAMHCAKEGTKIRCNSVHPGVIRTPMVERITEGLAETSQASREQLMSESEVAIPQGEYQEPEDIAFAALFLASDEACRITGTQLFVDGGITMNS